MSADFTSNRGRVDPCCGGGRTVEEQKSFSSALEFHRTTRAHTLAMVRELSQGQMDYEPAPGRWSVGEVLDHLILGQRLNLCYIAEVIALKVSGQPPILRLSSVDLDVSIGYLPKRMLPALEIPFNLANTFLPVSLRDFMTRYRVIPAQNPEITNPRRARPAEELRNDLISSLKETESLLESHFGRDYGEMVIQHPLLGNNNIPGLLRFLALHEQRHQSQINDILISPRFPGLNSGAGGAAHVS